MKRILLLTAALLCLATACHNNKQEEEILAQDSLYTNHKPYTRWWWFAAELDTNDIRDQLVWLRDHEFGGVEIAWIYPMFGDSATPKPSFLSEEWSAYVAFAKRTADSLGLGCDFTYGTLWPFSDVNLPDGDQTRNFFDSVEIAKRTITWDHPKVARILNHLSKEAFLRYASKMNRGLQAAYQGSRSGVFVDSWEVETPYLWTPGFDRLFMEEHGYDILPFMREKTLLDPAQARVFYDYMQTLSGLVLREFYEPYADNARRVGAFSRAQCGGAPTDLLTAFTLVDIPETEAILYEPSFSKITASAAALGGKQAVTAETFTCAYGWTSWRYKNGRGQSPHQGKEQPADLKLICDALFSNGTNQIIWHGFPYNKVGDTANYFYTTCQVSTSEQHNLSGERIKEFNKYMTRVSNYMRLGENYSTLAVYMPLEDSWMNGAYPDSLQLPWMWGQYEMRYINTPEQYKGMQPLWVNERYLSNATYDKDGLLHCGKATFRALYIDVEYMEVSAIKAITKLAKQGLPVYLARDPKEPGLVPTKNYAEVLQKLKAQPTVSSNPSIINTLPLIAGDHLPDFWIRHTSDDVFYVFVANPLTQRIKYPLDYCFAFTDQGATREITVNHHGKTEPYTLKFRPQESLMLKITKQGIEQIDLGYRPNKL